MAKVTLKCPACDKDVELGEVECPHCGVNLKSGESYEAKQKKAKGKDQHPEHFAGGIYAGVIVAFTLVVFAGYMYQSMVEKTITRAWDIFEYPVLKQQEVEDLVAIGSHHAAEGEPTMAKEKYGEARKAGEDLITYLDAQFQMIRPDDPYAKKRTDRYGRETKPQFNKRIARRLLHNMKLKAQQTLEDIPAA